MAVDQPDLALRAPPRSLAGLRLGKALLARAGQALLVALAVGLLTFVMMEALPGDAAYRVAASRYGYDFVAGGAS